MLTPKQEQDMGEIFIKSKFNGWIRSNKKDAKKWAKCKFYDLYQGTNRNNFVLDEFINKNLKGIKFSIKELKND
jgi:hypothetical protein